MSSSNSSGLQSSASEGNLQQLLDRRSKRMISNRESARRSRLRKQRRLDDLAAQVSQLNEEKNQILSSLHVTTQGYLSFDAQNTVLRAQAAELRHWLDSLNGILSYLCAGNGGFDEPEYEMAGLFENCWNCLSQPVVMAAAPGSTPYFIS